MILSISLGTRKLRPLEARKRAERPKARRRVFVRGMIGRFAEGVSNGAARPTRQAGAAGRRPRRDVPGVAVSRTRRSARYPLGVCRNRLAGASGARCIVPAASRPPGRRSGARESPSGPRPQIDTGCLRSIGRRRPLAARLPARAPQSALPIDSLGSTREHDRTDGREAGLARGPRRAAGVAVARQLRDLAARHPARRGGRPAVPDRRPQRLREGLARDAATAP